MQPVPSDDMDSVPGLEEDQQRALAGKLGITSLRALADADQGAIYAALGNMRPRPLAWATDPRATLAAVTLPKLTFRQEASTDA